MKGKRFGDVVAGHRYAGLAMSVTTTMIKGVSKGKDPFSHVDYRLARRSIIRAFHNGRLSQMDVCDAHPELIRAARHVGEKTSEACPICEDANVVLVSYAFGNGLGPAGHCVTNKSELFKLSQRATELTCYVVEVCPECSWNHLTRTFGVQGNRVTSKVSSS
jgi:hypothetical protein